MMFKTSEGWWDLVPLAREGFNSIELERIRVWFTYPEFDNHKKIPKPILVCIGFSASPEQKNHNSNHTDRAYMILFFYFNFNL